MTSLLTSTHLPTDGGQSLVSIVVLTSGFLEYTKLCLASVLRWTKPPFELVVLDAGSFDGTKEFLEGVALAAPFAVHVVRTTPEEKFHVGVERCLKLTKGDSVILLQNDAIVAHGWSQQLQALTQRDAAIGIAGPMTCYLPPPLGVEKIPYSLSRETKETVLGSKIPGSWTVSLDDIDKFAREHRESLRGKWYQVDRLPGLCLFLKRAILEKIQLKEDSGGLAFFDSARLCEDVRQAGFQVVLCRDLFVHQFGTRISPTRQPSRT